MTKHFNQRINELSSTMIWHEEDGLNFRRGLENAIDSNALDKYEQILKEYYSLARSPELSELEAKRLEKILDMAQTDDDLCLLISEVDELTFRELDFFNDGTLLSQDDEKFLENDHRRYLSMIKQSANSTGRRKVYKREKFLLKRIAAAIIVVGLTWAIPSAFPSLVCEIGKREILPVAKKIGDKIYMNAGRSHKSNISQNSDEKKGQTDTTRLNQNRSSQEPIAYILISPKSSGGIGHSISIPNQNPHKEDPPEVSPASDDNTVFVTDSTSNPSVSSENGTQAIQAIEEDKTSTMVVSQ
jgi:hypothetical protein